MAAITISVASSPTFLRILSIPLQKDSWYRSLPLDFSFCQELRYTHPQKLYGICVVIFFFTRLLKKQVSAPVWHGTPICLTLASIVSKSQSMDNSFTN